MPLFNAIRDRLAGSNLLSAGVFLLIAFMAWARAGTYFPLQWLFSLGGFLLVFGLFLFSPLERRPIFVSMLRDPVFYAGLALFFLMGVQWCNSNIAGSGHLPSRWFPWSFERGGVQQLFHWFFPVWVCILFFRHVFDVRSGMRVVYLVVWNAALLAALGVVLRLMGVDKVLGVWGVHDQYFLATFDYSNHAGAFFYLNAAVAGGLVHQAVEDRQPVIRSVIWSVCFFVCLVAAFLTLSRAAVLASILFIFLAVFAFFVKGSVWKSRSQWVSVGASICSLFLLVVCLFLWVGNGRLVGEARETLTGQSLVLAVEGRAERLASAWEVLKEYPVFGCGARGYRFFAYEQVPVEDWSYWAVHCDPLHFATEFGLAGTFCILVALYAMVKRAAAVREKPVIFQWVVLGVVLIFIHGWIDLPFRCPAVLAEWGVLLAALPFLRAQPMGVLDTRVTYF